MTEPAKKQLETGTAITKAATDICASIDKVTGMLNGITVLQALSVADQTGHNEFQEQATNTARKEAGKEPIAPKDDDIKAKVQKRVTQITNIQGITKVAGIAGDYLNNAVSTAGTIVKGYLEDTAAGQYVIQKVAAFKKYVKQLETDSELKIEQANKQSDVSSTTKNPGG